MLLIVSAVLSLFFGGSENIGWSDATPENFIFWQIRVPKTVTAIVAGCSLSVGGLILQVIFRNPLAGPYVLGISSGAALMVAISVLAGQSFHIYADQLAGKT